jgi:hypothetical protein
VGGAERERLHARERLPPRRIEHRNGRLPIALRAVAELPRVVAAPTAHLAAAEQRAAKLLAERNRLHARERLPPRRLQHRHRADPIGSRAVAELAVEVLTPAENPAPLDERAAVIAAPHHLEHRSLGELASAADRGQSALRRLALRRGRRSEFGRQRPFASSHRQPQAREHPPRLQAHVHNYDGIE